jgi:hypothetical protein
MGKTKTVLFASIAIVFSLVALELLTRGAFFAFGRWDGWGYPDYVYVYRPYISFAYSPYSGNRDRYGFTLDSDDIVSRDLALKENCEFRVFMLGGSTVLGRHLDNADDTLPARIERLLNNQSIKNVTFSVINAGKPSFTSVQTYLEHALYIKYSLRPDFVVHFDGSNDSVGHPKYWAKERYLGIKDNIHRYGEDMFANVNSITSLSGSLNAVLRNLASHSAFFFALHKTLNDPKVWLRQLKDTDVLKSNSDSKTNDSLAMSNWVDRHVQRYIFNVDLALRLGDSKTGVAYFLQPTMLPYMESRLTPRERDFLSPGNYTTEFHGHPKRDSKQMYFFKVREEFKKLISENKSPHVTIEDLSRLFDDKPSNEAYFGDYVHYLPTGREIIALRIFRTILPKIQTQIDNATRFNRCKTGSIL